MLPHHMSAKLFIKPPFCEPAEFIPLFHRWIQEQPVRGLLIDVADYRHVHHGPGVILAGFEGDYALDFRDGRVGLRYSRKRRGWRDETGQTDSERLRSRLERVLKHLFQAATALEAEQTLSQPVRFRTDEIELTFLDRLQTPNTRETLQALSDDIVATLASFQPDVAVELRPTSLDERHPFTVSVFLSPAPELRTLS
ncbi:MAG: hypothetical protein GXP42_09610 [Chloroflexi bacterium]|nr:hypothetical protein [Chloroflexota bacterium]